MAENTPKEFIFAKNTTTKHPVGQEQQHRLDVNGDVVPIGPDNPNISYPPKFAVGSGFIPALTAQLQFGRAANMQATDPPVDIWNGGGLYAGFPSEIETISISSSNAADTGQLIRIVGLDENGLRQEDFLTTNGLSLVTSTTLWSRAHVFQQLTGTINAGEITAHHTTTTSNIFTIIPIGQGQSQIAGFTVPSDKTLHLSMVTVMLSRDNGQAGSGVIALMIRTPTMTDFIQAGTLDISTNSPYTIDVEYVPDFVAGTDIIMRVLSVSDNNISASASFSYVLDESHA